MKATRCLLVALCLLMVLVVPVSAMDWQSYVYDTWGNSVPAPTAYVVEGIYSGQSLGLPTFDSPEDLFVSPNDDVYIVDKGRNTVLQLDGDMRFVREITAFIGEGGAEDAFSAPCGVFVDADDNIYVADSGNQRVVKMDKELNLLHIFGRPKTDLIDENAEYRPLKVVADTIGNVYVVAYGMYQGFVKYDANGEFSGFFGGNKVEITTGLILRQFWRKIFTDAQIEAGSRSVPIEYSNAAIDENNFIYAVVLQTSTSLDEIKRLNAKGQNTLHFSDVGTHYDQNDFGDIEKDYTATTTYVDNRMVDVAVGDDGIMAVLDGERGHVFLYDQDMNLLFTFGSKGDERGQFRQPVSIVRLGDDYLIADAIKKHIVRYTPTTYAQQVTEALSYYSEGNYMESVELWQNVLRKNANCRIAYKSIGKAYMQQGQYKEAMTYFENADDKEGYSDAWAEYRKQLIRDNLLWVILGFLAIVIILVMVIRLLRRVFRFEKKRKPTIFR